MSNLHIHDLFKVKNMDLELLVYSFKEDGKSFLTLLFLFLFSRDKFRIFVTSNTSLNIKCIPFHENILNDVVSNSVNVYSPYSERFNENLRVRFSEKFNIFSDKTIANQSERIKYKNNGLYYKLKAIIKIMRVEQWIKCFLVLAPLIFAQKYSDIFLWKKAIVGGFVFCLMASSVYVLNDLFDVWDDRSNEEKKNRPLANCSLSSVDILSVFILLQVAIFLMAYLYHLNGLEYLYFYLGLNTLYSYKLKSIFLLDVIVLTSFYMLRILFGAEVVTVEVSQWLVIFSFFIFFSLSLLKRFIELNSNYKYAGNSALKVRDYRLSDQPIIVSAGVCSGIMSAFVLALYIKFGTLDVSYTNEHFLWGIGLVVLYWILYMWMKALRGYIKYDPVKFAVRDRLSWFLFSAILVLGIFSI